MHKKSSTSPREWYEPSSILGFLPEAWDLEDLAQNLAVYALFLFMRFPGVPGISWSHIFGLV